MKYPADFEGVLTAYTVAGRIAIGGGGVNIVASDWLITKRVDGTKGVGRKGRGGAVEAVGTSGGMQLCANSLSQASPSADPSDSQP